MKIHPQILTVTIDGGSDGFITADQNIPTTSYPELQLDFENNQYQLLPPPSDIPPPECIPQF